jgi:hypothetical protein
MTNLFKRILYKCQIKLIPMFYLIVYYYVAHSKMMKLRLLKGLLVQKTPLLIITITMTLGLSSLFYQQSLTPVLFSGGSSALNSELTFLKYAFAAHGQEITLTLHNSSFGSLSSGGGNQISVFASYELNDDSIAGQTINAVMEVYAPNGTLIRTSSYPDGFIAQDSGGVEGLETTIRDPTLQSVTANVTFRNLDKTTMLSNDLRVDLNLAEEGTALTTTGESGGSDVESPGLDSLSEQTSDVPQPADEEESGVNDEDEAGASGEVTEDEEQDEGQQQLPLPLFGGG